MLFNTHTQGMILYLASLSILKTYLQNRTVTILILNFLNKYKNVSIIYAIYLDPSTDSSPVMVSLNRGKAPDAYGVTAEQIYNEGPVVMNCVKNLINNIPFNKEVPTAMKLGILNPIFKNKGSRKESQNCRGIIITSVLNRLLEAILKSRIKSVLTDCQNPVQRGLTENASPMNCFLLVEEFYRNNKDLNKSTYIAFMDKSVFDVVVYQNLIRKMYNSGIDGRNWLMINSLHHESQTAFKLQGHLSSIYINQLGVRQGGALSADLFKVYNGPLDRIQIS